MSIDLTADKIINLGPLPITNTFLAAVLISLIIIGIAYIFSRNVRMVPGRFQNFIEAIIEFMLVTATGTVGEEKRAKDFFPLIATFFIFILVANWAGLLPIFNTIGFTNHAGKFIPYLRPINTDLNATLTLAIISAVATQYYAIKYLGVWKHVKKYVSLNPVKLFVGVLELISEFTKIISLSLRLYGNIIAGDIVILTFTTLVGILVPLPFMGLEVVVGFVQAAVFAMLSLAFTSVATQELH